MTITIFESAELLTPAELDSIPVQSLAHSWSGELLPCPWQWSIVRDPKTLWFIASLPGGSDFNRQHTIGDFVEGLWEREVAELFIKESSGRYQEFNVSPGGAWWTVVLSSYRTREANLQELHEPTVQTVLGEGSWRAVLGVDQSCLSVALTSTSLIHVSGIVQKPRRHFLSSQPVVALEPDFHHPDTFRPLQFLAMP